MSNNSVEASVITREFDAPRQLVFDAWTQVEHLNNWMFPMPGCTCEFVSADIIDGGTSLHRVTMSNGHVMWLFTKYKVRRSKVSRKISLLAIHVKRKW